MEVDANFKTCQIRRCAIVGRKKERERGGGRREGEKETESSTYINNDGKMEKGSEVKCAAAE